MICVSACLAGINCKYNGGNNLVQSIRKLYEEGNALLVCPEQLGGLSTPRVPSERCGEKVITEEGKDVTKEFEQGARLALQMCQSHQCTTAILKSNSPSCGCHGCYDGTFTHTLNSDQNGIFASLLLSNGIKCFDEKEWEEK